MRPAVAQLSPFDDHLIKPVDAETLMQVIANRSGV